MAALTGEIEQTPPAYSAVKVGGERLYKAARRGETLDVPPRARSASTRSTSASFGRPAFAFLVRCSGGTYVRSLVRGRGRGARLRRAPVGRSAGRRSGPSRVEDARPPDDPGTPRAGDGRRAPAVRSTSSDEEARRRLARPDPRPGRRRRSVPGPRPGRHAGRHLPRRRHEGRPRDDPGGICTLSRHGGRSGRRVVAAARRGGDRHGRVLRRRPPGTSGRHPPDRRARPGSAACRPWPSPSTGTRARCSRPGPSRASSRRRRERPS